ncbi:MAG: DUF3043 domain-containing protein [Propionibacteriaceae bacterium]|nr:DUF3043 domain-containing protein [Propionibacteriaceae bacterium]
MGLFKPYEAAKPAETPETTSPSPVESLKTAPAKKSIPTPTRRQAEEARRQRIQPVLTKKEAKVREKAATYKAQDDAMTRMNARADITLIRDWVDRRWSIAEFALPIMLLVFVGLMVATNFAPTIASYSIFVVYGIFLLAVVDVLWMWIGLRQQLRTYFPDETLKRKFSFAMSRAMMMRRSRRPAPRVKRGSPWVWPNPEDKR